MSRIPRHLVVMADLRERLPALLFVGAFLALAGWYWICLLSDSYSRRPAETVVLHVIEVRSTRYGTDIIWLVRAGNGQGFPARPSEDIPFDAGQTACAERLTGGTFGQTLMVILHAGECVED